MVDVDGPGNIAVLGILIIYYSGKKGRMKCSKVIESTHKKLKRF